MKIALGCLSITAIVLLSVALAKWANSAPTAWGIGYFTAVGLMNLDKHVFGKWLHR